MSQTFPTTLNTHKKDWENTTPVSDTHPEEHNDIAEAVEALEAKVGANGSAVQTSHDYKLSLITAADKAAAQSSVSEVDNTSDATKNAATATLTNKTINADNNTISNLETDNFKTGVIDTDGTLAANSDTRLPTQQAVKEYVDAQTASSTVFPGTSAFSGTSPASYTDLDLSSIVGAGNRVVMLRIINNGGSTNYFSFRPNGQTYTQTDGAASMISVGRTGNVAASGGGAVVLVTTDASGIVEWISSGALSTSITVVAYW